MLLILFYLLEKNNIAFYGEEILTVVLLIWQLDFF